MIEIKNIINNFIDYTNDITKILNYNSINYSDLILLCLQHGFCNYSGIRIHNCEYYQDYINKKGYFKNLPTPNDIYNYKSNNTTILIKKVLKKRLNFFKNEIEELKELSKKYKYLK